MFAAQKQALRTNTVKASIDKQQVSASCGNATESATSQVHAKSLPKRNTARHDRVSKKIHWLLCKKYDLECTYRWYQHNPEPITENDKVEIVWNVMIQTDRVIKHRGPDIVAVEGISGTCMIIDILQFG